MNSFIQRTTWSERLILLAVILAFCVIGLGAFTRLTDAGLGCPDWPGCYGHLTVPSNIQSLQKIKALFPTQPLVAVKAWAEMVHRYFAGTLGCLILATLVVMIRRLKQLKRKKIAFAVFALALLLLYQPILGMWTVTLKLLPVVVSQHLLGGMLIVGLLWLLWLHYDSSGDTAVTDPLLIKLRPWALLGLVFLFCQIALGAWTSTNYASISCPGFPYCKQGYSFFPTQSTDDAEV